VEYQRIVQEDPNDARTLLKIGDLQARLSAYPEAIATYDRVGQYYAAQGFALKAIAVYKQIRELIKKHAPDLADRYGHIVPKLADIYTQLGLTSDALAAWDEVATRLQRAGRDRDAIEVFRKMVELDAGNPLPHLRLAEACCRVQSLDEAIESFWTAAELLLNLERSDDALKVVERSTFGKTPASPGSPPSCTWAALLAKTACRPWPSCRSASKRIQKIWRRSACSHKPSP
jgi:tetratricopeptide (TPR) repeat protein